MTISMTDHVDKKPYDWPTPTEWEAMSKRERLERAQELVEQADRQRYPYYTGKFTLAQEDARRLREIALGE